MTITDLNQYLILIKPILLPLAFLIAFSSFVIGMYFMLFIECIIDTIQSKISKFKERSNKNEKACKS